MGGRQKGGNLPPGLRYQAFLSYRSTDRALAGWLHNRLEAFRTPRALVGAKGAHGAVPRRLAPIFMDRRDARTGPDVDKALEAELASARDLIVLCTPEAAESASWVSTEIETFRRRRRDGLVHAIIGKGRPPECFPAPLLHRRPDGSIQMPLAADLAPAPYGDGKQRAFIKLMAGLLGVPFDALWRRERRRRRAVILRAAAFAALIGLGGLYAGLHATGSARSRAFAAAAAYEFNQGEYDRAAFLALSGLPPEGSIISLFWPEDAERELRRVGQQELAGIVPTKGASDGFRSAYDVKRSFLIAYDGQTLIETDIGSAEEHRRSFAAACEAARAAGGAKDCVPASVDLDASGQALALALNDGSLWRVDRDGAASELAAPNCAEPFLDEGLSLRRNGACDPAEVAISDDGAYVLAVRRSGAMTSFALASRTGSTYPALEYCLPQLDDDACRDAGPDVFRALAQDQFVVSAYDHTRIIFAGTGQQFELGDVASAAAQGPNGEFTMVSDRGRKTAMYSVTYADELRPVSVGEMSAVSTGICDALTPGGAVEDLSGCLTSAVAISPSSEDIAMAQSNGDISILRTVSDDGRAIPPQRTIATECLPPRGLDLLPERPCKIEKLVFSPDGVALAVLDSQGTVSVFRVDDGYLRQADGKMLASVHVSAGVFDVAFGSSGDDLRVVTRSGSLLNYRLPLAEGESQWPVLGTDHKAYHRSQRGGDLRRDFCQRMGGGGGGLVQLPEADLAKVSAAFPGLGLREEDRTPCKKRGLLAIP
jgi:hypothetical protein